MFTYNVDGQPVQVVGQLKDGAGQFFDQATGTYYNFSGGKLTGMRTPDPGKAEATSEPLWTAVSLAAGGPALKAGGVAAWQGFKTLMSREALEGLTADNVLPRAVSGAELRAAMAESHLPPPGQPGIGGEPVPGPHAPLPPAVEHVPPAVEHTPPTGPGEHVPAGPHAPVLPDSPPPVEVHPGPVFNLDNPLDHMPPELRTLSEQHLTGSGEMVLGPFQPEGGGPSYAQVAQDRGASYFDIGQAWYSYTPTQQLAANQHVLDIAIANRDRIILSVPFGKLEEGSYTIAEIEYLQAHGYQRVGANTLIPPG
jgi:hypothetical protein